MVDYAIMMISGEEEKIYMGIITAIGLSLEEIKCIYSLPWTH
nr:hypothetical protein [Sulfolobus islandicus]